MTIEGMYGRVAKLRNEMAWHFRRSPGYLLELAQWLFWSPRTFWLALIGLATIGSLWLPISCAERQIRWTGMALELGGLAMAFVGLYSDHKQHGGQTFKEHLSIWRHQRPRYRRNVIMAAGSGIVSVSGVASGHGFTSLGPNATLEERVASLEKKFIIISTEQHTTSVLFKQEFQKVSDKLKEETLKREAGDLRIDRKLKDAIAGGFYLQATGAIYFALGLFFSTASLELAYYVRGTSDACPANFTLALAPT